MTNFSGVSLQTLIIADFCNSKSEPPNEFVSRKFGGEVSKSSRHATKLSEVVKQVLGMLNIKYGVYWIRLNEATTIDTMH